MANPMKGGSRIDDRRSSDLGDVMRATYHALVAVSLATCALSAFAADAPASRLPEAPANFKIVAKQEGVPTDPAIRPLLTWRAGDQSNGKPIARFSIEKLTTAPPPAPAITAWTDVGKVDGPNGATGRPEYSFVSPWITRGVAHYRVCSVNARGKVCSASHPVGPSAPQNVAVDRTNQYQSTEPRQDSVQQDYNASKPPLKNLEAKAAVITKPVPTPNPHL